MLFHMQFMGVLIYEWGHFNFPKAVTGIINFLLTIEDIMLLSQSWIVVRGSYTR